METIIISGIVLICTLIGIGLVLEPLIRHINDEINEEEL